MPSDINERTEKLSKIIREVNSFNILFTQPDPDAIASAIGFSHLLDEKFGVASRIFYCGHISHPQNKYIMNKYNLTRQIRPVEKMPDSTANAPVVLIDSHSLEDSRLPENLKSKVSPVITIDHHRGDYTCEETDKNFVWIEDVGAASTLIVELIGKLEVEIAEYERWLATLLALGIYTDTKGLISAGNRDRTAYGTMADIASIAEVAELIKYPIPEAYFKKLHYSLETFNHEGPRLVAGIGVVDPDEGDYVSSIADDLMRMEGVTLILVWGIVGDSVRISTRGRDASFPLQDFMKKKFGIGSGSKTAPDGHSEGGVILDLKLGLWLSPTTAEEICRVVHKRICEMVFNK